MERELLPNGVRVRVDTKEYFRVGREERHFFGMVGFITDNHTTISGEVAYGVAINSVRLFPFFRGQLTKVREVCEWVEDE